MKTRFDFCHCVGLLGPDTKFVAVWFGSSKRDQRILKRLEPLRFRRDVFFQKHSAKVADFLYRVAESLYPGCPMPLLRLKHYSMNATEFLRYLDDAELLPSTTNQRVFYTLQQTDPRFYAKTHQLWKRN